jgi:hypothetical protein
MIMTVQEIMDQAKMIKGVSISLSAAIRWINDAMDKLSTLYDTACTRDDTTIEAEDTTTEYELPDDNVGVVKVLDSDDNRFLDYMVDNGYIRFDYTGEYTVHYLVQPDDVTGADDTPEIHASYHKCLPDYVASKVSKPYDKELESEFFRMAEQVNIRLSRPKRRGMRIPARAWR